MYNFLCVAVRCIGEPPEVSISLAAPDVSKEFRVLRDATRTFLPTPPPFKKAGENRNDARLSFIAFRGGTKAYKAQDLPRKNVSRAYITQKKDEWVKKS